MIGKRSGMSDDLPVILVSAADVSTADQIISELIEEDGSDIKDDHVWELSNKYYTARVRLRALPDAAEDTTEDATSASGVEAHVIYLAEHECTSAALEARAAAGDACGVRLALCARADAALPTELRAAARARGYELLALAPGDAPSPSPSPAPAPAGPFPELRGLARAREALHAHVWPGLVLARPAPAFLAGETNGAAGSASESESGGSADDGAEEEEEEEEAADEAECVRRAEAFADALSALQAAAAARSLEGREGGGGRGERALRAEQLLQAFCRALGADSDLL